LAMSDDWTTYPHRTSGFVNFISLNAFSFSAYS
jgi:hypothetical protein